jgi:4a-hydroxytetrahydrobiopterin dehydratase
MSLAEQKCVPCHGGVPPLPEAEAKRLLGEIHREWHIVDGHHLERTFAFPDFRGALAFTNRIGEVAEQEGHHPDIHLGWGRARITIWTHAIDGLTESDFVLAAKIDRIA